MGLATLASSPGRDRSVPLAADAIREAFGVCRRAFVNVGMVSCIVNLLMLTGPFFMLQVYDRVLTSRSVPTLIALGGIAVVLYAFYGFLTGIRSRVLSRIGSLLDTRLSGMAFEQTVMLPLRHGRQAERIDPTQDLERLRTFLSSPGPSALFDLPWMPAYLAVVFLFHPVLGFVAAAGVLLMCVLIALNELTTREPAARMASQSTRRQTVVDDARANAEAIAAMGMMTGLKDHWSEETRQLLAHQERVSDRAALFAAATRTTRFVLQSGLLAVGAYLAIGDVITPGIMIAASIITARAVAPVEQAVGSWRGFLAARQGLQRLRRVFDAAPDEDIATDLQLPSSQLAVEGLFVAPPGGGAAILQNVSFSLNAGEALGLIGSSGSGKSTLGRALVGIWPGARGKVRLDGSELDHWDRDRLGAAIGYLPQDVQLFAGTVAQNIARFQPGCRSEDVIRAARQANAHDIVARLPDGYDTQIGEAGAILSGGQRQRIALARALYGDPFLIVLDEPNSNLDAEGEAALTDAIAQARRRGCIVIVIAHRPSAISAVDFILYMIDGKVAAYGARDQVLKRILAPKDQAAQNTKIQNNVTGLVTRG